MRFSQVQSVLPKRMNAIVVLELRRYVPRLIVLVNSHPRFTACKASVCARVPLP